MFLSSDHKILLAVLGLTGLVAMMSFQNCSRPLVQVVAPPPSQASDLSDMLQSSEQEIQETKHNLRKNAETESPNLNRREPISNNVMVEDGYVGHRDIDQRGPASAKKVSGVEANLKAQPQHQPDSETAADSAPVKIKLKRSSKQKK